MMQKLSSAIVAMLIMALCSTNSVLAINVKERSDTKTDFNKNS